MHRIYEIQIHKAAVILKHEIYYMDNCNINE